MSPALVAKLWRERIVALIVGQLVQGVTPQKIALTVVIGFSLGIIPILGTTTMLCAVAAIRLKLNQPIIQLVNWLVYPLQLALLLPFVRFGEWLMHAPFMSFSLMELLQKFHESPVKFFQEFGVAGLQGFIAWLIITPILGVITYSVLLVPLKRLVDMKAAAVNSAFSRVKSANGY
jgi:uncharacterized protein (DUF2062 family)